MLRRRGLPRVGTLFFLDSRRFGFTLLVKSERIRHVTLLFILYSARMNFSFLTGRDRPLGVNVNNSGQSLIYPLPLPSGGRNEEWLSLAPVWKGPSIFYSPIVLDLNIELAESLFC